MEGDIDAAVEYLANNIINAARSSIQKLEYITQHEYPDAIKKEIEDKRKLRRLWQNSTYPSGK